MNASCAHRHKTQEAGIRLETHYGSLFSEDGPGTTSGYPKSPR
jgi:hypothetical protein